MESNKKVYLVFQGCYSDRDVVYVASSREQAEQYNKIHSSYEMEIVEIPLDEELPIESLYVATSTVFNGVREQDISANMISEQEIEYCPGLYTKGNIRFFHSKEKWFQFHMYITARDAQHAIKIASEWEMMLIAQPELYPEIFDGNYRQGIFNFYTREYSDLKK